MVPYLDLKSIKELHSESAEDAVMRVCRSGRYLYGQELMGFESEYASYIGTRNCVGVGNGLDALKLIFRALIETGRIAPGSEVILPSHTFIATELALTWNGLKPVPVETCADNMLIDESQLESHLSDKTSALLLVHLYGRCAYSEKIDHFCKEHDLLLIEDNAQAHGCMYEDRRTGSLGIAAAHSFYPGKNLGAMGDAGAVTTNDDALAAAIRAISNYGGERKYEYDYKGVNSRMDELQAAVLRERLKFLDEDNARRKEIAHALIAGIANPSVKLPSVDERDNVWHIFPVLCSDRAGFMAHLEKCGVGCLIHYPIAIHRQKCYSEYSELSFPVTESICSTEVSLPCNPAMTDEQVQEVISAVNSFSLSL